MTPVVKSCVRTKKPLKKTKPKLERICAVQYQEVICLHVSALIVETHNSEQHCCHTPVLSGKMTWWLLREPCFPKIPFLFAKEETAPMFNQWHEKPLEIRPNVPGRELSLCHCAADQRSTRLTWTSGCVWQVVKCVKHRDWKKQLSHILSAGTCRTLPSFSCRHFWELTCDGWRESVFVGLVLCV